MNFKYLLSIILILILSFGACSTAFATDNIPDGYTPIYTIEDLNNVRNNLSGKYILMNDIDLSVYKKWEQIGTEAEPFTGKINGNGYCIVNLCSDGGVFGRLSNAIIENLGICDSKINRQINNMYAGILANMAFKTNFKNCYTSGTVFGTTGNGVVDMAYDFCAGGILGYSELSSLENCYSLVNVSLEYTVMNFYAAGGIAGQSKDSEYSCCYAVSNFEEKFVGYGNTEGLSIYTGGLIGNSISNDTFKNCYFADSVESAIGLPKENPQSTKALTNDELELQSSYEGFDFENFWSMNESGYAVLDFEKNKDKTPEQPVVNLSEAKIIKVPLCKRFAFGQKPKSPDGITIELKYSDGTTVTEKVVTTEKGYYVNGEFLEEAGGTDEVVYGITSAGYFMNEGKILISYKYLALPLITDLLNIIFG